MFSHNLHHVTDDHVMVKLVSAMKEEVLLLPPSLKHCFFHLNLLPTSCGDSMGEWLPLDQWFYWGILWLLHNSHFINTQSFVKAEPLPRMNINSLVSVLFPKNSTNLVNWKNNLKSASKCFLCLYFCKYCWRFKFLVGYHLCFEGIEGNPEVDWTAPQNLMALVFDYWHLKSIPRYS